MPYVSNTLETHLRMLFWLKRLVFPHTTSVIENFPFARLCSPWPHQLPLLMLGPLLRNLRQQGSCGRSLVPRSWRLWTADPDEGEAEIVENITRDDVAGGDATDRGPLNLSEDEDTAHADQVMEWLESTVPSSRLSETTESAPGRRALGRLAPWQHR